MRDGGREGTGSKPCTSLREVPTRALKALPNTLLATRGDPNVMHRMGRGRGRGRGGGWGQGQGQGRGRGRGSNLDVKQLLAGYILFPRWESAHCGYLKDKQQGQH
ncbi:MAG: hypothetical protein FRX49_01960 [Trebouxia sp. A1-2]|nr:MAG: hypothetical protein FRX49_01960 [Trebouxia sp. A1-2]